MTKHQKKIIEIINRLEANKESIDVVIIDGIIFSLGCLLIDMEDKNS